MRAAWILGGALALGCNAWLLLAFTRRVAAERRLRESNERRFSEFASIASDWFWETDAQHRLTYVSEGIKVVGASVPSFLGKRRSEVAQMLAGAPSPPLLALEARMDHHQSFSRFVYAGRQQNGQLGWYEISGIARHAADGAFIGYRGIGRDVTAFHASQARIAESEMRFREGIEAMVDGFALWDAEGRLLSVNQRTAEIFPYLRAHLRIGVTFRDLMAIAVDALPDALSPAAREAAIEAHVRRFARREGPVELRNSFGRMIEITDRGTSDGGAVSIYRDVTDQRRAVDDLVRSEARFRDFADVASDWFWETGPDHRFTLVSSGVRLVGAAVEAMLGKSRSEFVRSLGGKVADELREMEAMMDRREVIQGVSYATLRADDTGPCVVEIDGKPMFDATGGFLGYRGTSRDITARMQQKAALMLSQEELARALMAEREMNAEQRRFVSMASHEFRTPLAVIDGAAQRIVARLGAPPPDVQERVDRIRAAVSRLNDMIDRTLSSARLEDGRIAIEPLPFDVCAQLREVCERQRQISPGFAIALALPDRPVQVEADAKLLDQVFTNLLSNAVKYSGRARRIEVSMTASDAVVLVTIRDHGLGIAPADIPKLFTRFFRAGSAAGIPGTGIGLHLVRELVTMHGGRVTVESELGVGTVFVVALPQISGQREIVAA